MRAIHLIRELQPKAHLLPHGPGVQGVTRRHINYTNTLGAEPFERAATGEIVTLAGDPEVLHAVAPSHWDDHPAGPLSVMSATECGFHCIPHLSGVADDVIIPTYAQPDAADIVAGRALHSKLIGWDAPRIRRSGLAFGQDEVQVAVGR